MQYAFIILVQGFCPLKIKIIQFPGGFRLNSQSFSCLPSILQPLQFNLRILRLGWYICVDLSRNIFVSFNHML